MARPRPKVRPLKCKDCNHWYGAEDDEVGPCSIKNMRGDKRYMTIGTHDCDEGPMATKGNTTTADLYTARGRARMKACEDQPVRQVRNSRKR